MSLETIHSNIGEHNEVKIRATQMIMDDIKLLNWLENDTFKENFDFRSQTVEETKYFVETRPWCDIAEYFFAYIDGKPVGNVGVGIDTKFIKQIGTAIMLYESKLLKATEPGVDDSNPTKAIELYKKVGSKLSKRT